LSGEFERVCEREIVRKVMHEGTPPDVVCFTGGEPMLSQRERDFNRAIKLLVARGFEIHFETNGTIPPNGKKATGKLIDFWSVSPKLTQDFGKVYHPAKISYHDSLQTFIDSTGDGELQFKFVVQDEQEVSQIKMLMDSLKDSAGVPVIIQPERYKFEEGWVGTPRLNYLNAFKKLIPWASRRLSAYNWRVLPQLHYLLWRDERRK